MLKFCGALEKFFGKRFLVEIAWKIFVKTFFFFFFWRSPEKFLWRPFFFFFWRALGFVSLVLGLGLEHSCPWPRECLSSERLSLALALASDFFLCPWPWPRALCPRLHLRKIDLAPVTALNYMCYKFFLDFSGFNSGGLDPLNLPLVAPASIVPTRATNKAWNLNVLRAILRLTDIRFLSSKFENLLHPYLLSVRLNWRN